MAGADDSGLPRGEPPRERAQKAVVAAVGAYYIDAIFPYYAQHIEYGAEVPVGGEPVGADLYPGGPGALKELALRPREYNWTRAQALKPEALVKGPVLLPAPAGRGLSVQHGQHPGKPRPGSHERRQYKGSDEKRREMTL